MVLKESKKLAMFDIDNTLYSGHIVVDFPKYLSDKGIIEKHFVHQIRTALDSFQKNEINYESLAEKLLIIMASAFKGIKKGVIDNHIYDFIKSSPLEYFGEIVSLLKLYNYDIYIVSGEPECIGKAIVNLFKLTGELSSKFYIENGVYTGEVGNLLSSNEAKSERVKLLLNRYSFRDSTAFGDSIVDLYMLQSVDFPICVEPSNELRTIAKEQNWIIIQRMEIIKEVEKFLEK